MSTNARWIVGLLLALVIGLGVALVIVAGDDSSDEPETVTVQTSVEPEATETEPTETETEATETGPSGGVEAP